MGALSLEEFLLLRIKLPVIDVRTPAEFRTGHIPGAINCPLFSNAERASIGTLYKQEGRKIAIMAGLNFIGPRLAAYAAELAGNAISDGAILHCWRGGMRSGAAAWLASFTGIKTRTLQGGYKAFRAGCRLALEKQRRIIVLGGYTGSGKSDILKELQNAGQQILDLETLACHRGSAFGDIDLPPQVSQEHFENLVADQLFSLDERPVWVEDESRLLGRLEVPPPFFAQMRRSPVLFLQSRLEDRVERLCRNYGHAAVERLQAGLYAIRKRLGPERTQTASQALASGDNREFCRIVLNYYDRAYEYGLSRRNPASVISVDCDADAKKIAAKLIELVYDRKIA
jgi:tRNA 2-selenouridine synthase